MNIVSALVLSIYILIGLTVFVLLTSPVFWKWVGFNIKNLFRRAGNAEKAMAQMKRSAEVLQANGYVVRYSVTKHVVAESLPQGQPVRETA